MIIEPDSKVHEANMGPIWGRQDPGGPHVSPMSFAIWGCIGPRVLTHNFTVYICESFLAGVYRAVGYKQQFFHNSCNRHPAFWPWWEGMGCLLWNFQQCSTFVIAAPYEYCDMNDHAVRDINTQLITNIATYILHIKPLSSVIGWVFNSLRPSDAYMCQWTNHHWFR